MDLPEEWTADTVNTNGADLECYRTGDGPPLLMAHGLYDNGRRWVPLAADFCDEYEVVTFDARGHGRSEAPEAGYSLEDRVADLRGPVRGRRSGARPVPHTGGPRVSPGNRRDRT
jgi:alpha-beta hydrolase superfamily lysophospholipase